MRLNLVFAFGAVALALAAALTLIGPIAHCAGIVALALLAIIQGAGAIVGGLERADLYDVRIGLMTLGGFVAAALILLANAVMSTMVPAAG